MYVDYSNWSCNVFCKVETIKCTIFISWKQLLGRVLIAYLKNGLIQQIFFLQCNTNKCFILKWFIGNNYKVPQ